MSFFKSKKTEKNSLDEDEKKQKKIQRERQRLENDPSYAAKQFLNATKFFEEDLVDNAKRSEIKAWRVAGFACVTSVALSLALIGLTPLKETKPFVLRVDNNTGKVDFVTSLKDAKSSYGEEVNKYFLSQYVKNREGYDWYTVQETFNTAMLMSAEDEQNRIQTKFAQPDAPYKIFQNKKRINIEINSVSFINENQAQVRYQKITESADGGQYQAATGLITPAPEIERFIATITFDYRNAPTKEKERYMNPLGFTAISYRNDTESGVN